MKRTLQLCISLFLLFAYISCWINPITLLTFHFYSIPEQLSRLHHQIWCKSLLECWSGWRWSFVFPRLIPKILVLNKFPFAIYDRHLGDNQGSFWLKLLLLRQDCATIRQSISRSRSATQCYFRSTPTIPCSKRLHLTLGSPTGFYYFLPPESSRKMIRLWRKNFASDRIRTNIAYAATCYINYTTSIPCFFHLWAPYW